MTGITSTIGRGEEGRSSPGFAGGGGGATFASSIYSGDGGGGGGSGGMRIVQLHAPAGSDADGTGTSLDDGIQIVQQHTILSGQAKTDWIFAGDIRSRPKILPLSFGYRAAAETRWVHSGVTSWRASATGPRSSTAKPGQDWRFDAIYAA